MKFLLDLGSDLSTNLDILVEANGIAKSELIRRGAEVAVVLYGVGRSDVRDLLLKSLRESKKALEDYRNNLTELRIALSKSAALSTVLSSISIVNEGRESTDIIKIYAESIGGHLKVVNNSDKLDKPQLQAIDEDLTTFIGILRKLDHGEALEQNGNQYIFIRTAKKGKSSPTRSR